MECCSLLQRTYGPHLADRSHVCRLICIFCQVHALAENDLHFIRRCGGELCEAFYLLRSAINSSILWAMATAPACSIAATSP